MKRTALLLVAVGIFMIASMALAQTSELYLSDYSLPTTYVVQNGQIVRQWDRDVHLSDGPGLVVHDTVKNIGRSGGRVGYEYALDGTPLPGRYLNPSFQSLYDGATDGVHNWSIGVNDFDTNFAVVVGDANWGDLQVAFVPETRSDGITYDASNNSLWITNPYRVQQLSLDGTLMSEFTVDIHYVRGIAWDRADDTLWISHWGGNDLSQFDKQGNLLQRISVPGLSGRIVGAEFRSPQCQAFVRVHGPVHTPGDRLPVQVHIAHHRPKTVTVAWELSLIDPWGRVVAERVTAPHTFEPGDVVDVEVALPLPEDLEGGTYTLSLGISGMAGIEGATTSFRVLGPSTELTDPS